MLLGQEVDRKRTWIKDVRKDVELANIRKWLYMMSGGKGFISMSIEELE